MKKLNRIYVLDLFRFIAALTVVLYHYLYRGWAADNLLNIRFDEIGHFFKYGYLGVEFFFVISGFVIMLSIKHKSISKFLLSRFTRLYPIYWASIVFTFLVIILFGYPKYDASIRQLLWNFSMFQNYLGVKSIDGVYWTLFIEMKFYIFIVGAYLVLNKIKELKLEYFILIWLILSLIYIPFKSYFMFKVLNYFLILNWSSYFIAGILFHQIYEYGLSIKYQFLLLITFVLSLHHAFIEMEYHVIHYKSFYSPVIVATVVFSFYWAMYLVANRKMKSINSPMLSQLGMLTYPLYLIHQNIGYVTLNNFEGRANKYILVVTTVITMISISYIMSKYYEPKVSSYLKNVLQKHIRNLRLDRY